MNVYEKLVEINDRQTDWMLEQQIDVPKHRNDGGVKQPHTVIPTVSNGGTADTMASMATALLSPESKHYQSVNGMGSRSTSNGTAKRGSCGSAAIGRRTC